MDTERIKALLCAAEEGSFKAAAEKLGYTTSGISRMMNTLEEETGFPLLIRGRNGVVPTEEFRQMLPVMHELLSAADKFDQTAAELAGLAKGRIRIGTSYYAYYEWFARSIADFEKTYEGIEIEIVEGTSTELLEAMEEHRADLCIVSERAGGYDWIPLREDQLLACLPAGHPLSSSKSFPVTEFAREDFIELYPGKETDNSRMFRACGVTPNVRYATSDNYAAYSMVAAGLGITCTNAIIGSAFTKGVVYLPLDPPFKVQIGMAIPKEREMSPAAKRFAQFVIDRFHG